MIFINKNATIIINGFLGEKIEADASVQCGMCKHMIDSFACKIYPATSEKNYNDIIPDKYRLGKEACPDFIQVEVDKTLR